MGHNHHNFMEHINSPEIKITDPKSLSYQEREALCDQAWEDYQTDDMVMSFSMAISASQL